MDVDVPSPTPSELDAFDEMASKTEELGLPPPLRSDGGVGQERPSLASIGRKRTIDEAMNPSSDLPTFSSDDLSASLETYSSRHRKRQHARHWWEDRRASLLAEADPGPARRKRSPFTRKDDSGVWMNSDDSELPMDEDPDDLPTDLDTGGQPIGQHDEGTDLQAGSVESVVPPYWQHQPESMAEWDNPQKYAIDRLQRAMDNGWQTHDLGALGLEVIPSSLLRPLHLCTRHLPDHVPPSQEAFEPLTPTLNLLLFSNDLLTLPGEVYKLSSLTTLSARHNRLTEISPSIVNLKNLQELNLSVNALRYLPYEILDLCRGKLAGLRIKSNPWLEPFPRNWSPTAPVFSDEVFLTWLHAKGPTLRARSTVAYLDAFGNACRGSCPAPSKTQECLHPSAFHGFPSSDHPGSPPSTRTPSLIELCLRKCRGSAFLEDFALSPASEEHIPPAVVPLLQEAWETHDAGEKPCSVCRESYVVPRTEWLEWWSHFSKHETVVKPFLRRGCSWACVPDGADGAMDEEWRDCGWGFSCSQVQKQAGAANAAASRLVEGGTRTNVPRVWPAVARELRLSHGIVARHAD